MSDALPVRSFASPHKTRWFALGALAIAGTAFFLIASGGIGKNLVYYWGPTQLVHAGDKAIGATIRLGGQVVPDSVHFDAHSSSLTFHMRDSGAEVAVHSTGVPPQMFRAGIGVVVEGTMTRSGVFESSRLMVSHNNQYHAPKPGEPASAADLMKTTAGLSGEKKR